jgi:hypothetical protein
LGVSALSDQLAAGAVTMGERLGSDDARCSTQLPNLRSVGGRAHRFEPRSDRPDRHVSRVRVAVVSVGRNPAGRPGARVARA